MRLKFFSVLVFASTVFASTLGSSWSIGQEVLDTPDLAAINKIKEEGMDRSQAMQTISFLTDVYGPRLTGSPQSRIAGEWASAKMSEWGLENTALESWGPFGRGWSLERSSVDIVEPSYAPLIAHAKAWSPSLARTVQGTPIYFDAETEEELESFRGKLGRAIVLISPPRALEAHFEPESLRQTDQGLLALANAEPPSARGNRGGRGGPRRAAPPTPETPATTPSTENGATVPAVPAVRDPRIAGRILADKWQMAYEEGASVILEPGRGDGGNVFVASVTMPRAPEDPANNNPFSRGPRPWSPEATIVPLPQLVLAAEHYNRLVRMIERGTAPVLQIDVVTRFHADDLNSFNVIAEIPGTDLKDEIVMLGAHFDSWQAGTGATDNAVGCGVAMEAVRILKATGVQPRRTIRIALWTGEEQGLLGSRAYVEQHFGRTIAPSRDSAPAAETEPERRERPRNAYELLPEHEKLSAYFNLDNGAGKIRGIYLQGNEAVRPIFRSWLAPFTDMQAATISSSNTGGTDHLSFDGIGLPGFQFIQDTLEYDTRTHHSSMDVYDRLIEDDVKQASVIMASFVYNAAMRNDKLPRKPLNGDIISTPTVSEPTTPEVATAQADAAEPSAATEQAPAAATSETSAATDASPQ